MLDSCLQAQHSIINSEGLVPDNGTGLKMGQTLGSHPLSLSSIFVLYTRQDQFWVKSFIGGVVSPSPH